MQLGLLLFSRFTVYFDEVVRHGSIRRASEHLLISPSAIDRHILNMEESLGITLFERLPRGLRLTAAGEILIGHIRNCRKELRHAQAQIEDLRGSRRGSVTLVVVEGMTGFIADALAAFHVEYPGVCQQFRTASSDRVCKLVADGSADIGITFNSVIPGNLRVERTLVDQMGALIPVGHPLARADDVSLSQCAEYKIIAPDETMAVYLPLQTVWERTVGGSITGSYQAGSMEMVKSLVGAGAGIGFATALDMRGASAGHKFRFLPLRERNVPLSVLSLVRHSSRSLSSAATLLAAHLARFMRAQEGPGVG
jgi:DNA-binding transcriptional LysR family regulator